MKIDEIVYFEKAQTFLETDHLEIIFRNYAI